VISAGEAPDPGIVGYDVQTAVDAEHRLIVAHEVIFRAFIHKVFTTLTGP
jgi:hypothetical protein